MGSVGIKTENPREGEEEILGGETGGRRISD